ELLALSLVEAAAFVLAVLVLGEGGRDESRRERDAEREEEGEERDLPRELRERHAMSFPDRGSSGRRSSHFQRKTVSRIRSLMAVAASAEASPWRVRLRRTAPFSGELGARPWEPRTSEPSV